jgi:hypothetical protein
LSVVPGCFSRSQPALWFGIVDFYVEHSGHAGLLTFPLDIPAVNVRLALFWICNLGNTVAAHLTERLRPVAVLQMIL